MSHGVDLVAPGPVDSVAAQERRGQGAGCGDRRFELRDDAAAAHDRVALAAMLDSIE